MIRIPVLTIVFQNPLKLYEVPFFRGAIISKIPEEFVLFHNHIDEGFRFSYPLIQYKTIGGKAAIVCVGEGTKDIGKFFEGADFQVNIVERQEILSVENVWASQWLLQTWEDEFTYSLRRWLPLNKENYQEYMNLEGVADRVLLLEKVLTGNLLSMCKGLDIYIDKQITCKITSVDSSRCFKFKNIKMQGFDVKFKTNVYIVDYIGIGKGSSLGFGSIKRIITPKNQEYEGDE